MRMCGINGFSWSDENLIKAMNRRIKHRGPDDEGYFVDDKISIGNVRLAIIDLSEAGHQPMCNENGDIWIVYNGEIYNFLELREELEKKGHKFKSNTDTEVILHSYEEWGPDAVLKFNGMWAFAIYDKRKNILFLSRDRFGIKPLYYYYDGSNMVFSSEIKGILSYDKIKPKPNDKIIFDFLCYDLLDHTEETFFEKIKKILPGHNAIFDMKRRTLRIYRYYNLLEHLKENTHTSTGVFKKLFLNAVKRRLVADVPVGSCLSGGLDSSSIVCAMKKLHCNAKIKVFSLVFPGLEIDESTYQEEVIKKCSVDRYITTFTTQELLEDLNDLIWTQEEPFGTLSIYGQYRVMKLANTHNMKVLLDGQGSDEILAGYHHFFGNYFYELFKTLKWRNLIKEIIVYYKNYKNITPIYHFMTNILPSFLTKIFWYKRYKFLNKKFVKKYIHRKSKDIMWKIKSLNDALYIAETYYSLPRLLKFEDKNAMRWSIESRVPFCDHELVEYVLSLPPETKISNGTTKVILRTSLKDILPESILKRKDKIAFATPDKYILRSSQGIKLLKQITNDPRYKSRKYWNHKVIEKMIKKHIAGKKNYEKILWKIIITELWFRRFIDGK